MRNLLLPFSLQPVWGLAALAICAAGCLAPNGAPPGYAGAPFNPGPQGSPNFFGGGQPAQPVFTSPPTGPSVGPTVPSGPIASPGAPPNLSLTPTIRSGNIGLPPGNLLAGSGEVDGRSIPFLADRPTPRGRHSKSMVAPGSNASKLRRARSVQAGREPRTTALAPGLAATPQEDLRYRGGKIIRDLKYINIFVGGKQRWDVGDRQKIDGALESAMIDPHLNHVVMQYFNDQPITTEFQGSFLLEGYQPTNVTQREIRDVLRVLYGQGALKSLDLRNTVVNFMLPSGVILEDPDAATAEYRHSIHPAIPAESEASSKEGLGGYHGSVHFGQDTVYYAVCVYSERRSDGFQNGIPVFKDPWKNVVATFYHELQEARTDPDVDDAVTMGRESALGWTSDRGEEIGDFPIEESQQISLVIKEVPLADGSGTVPIQLMYSNAVHGPEGPIDRPHRGPVLTQPPRRTPSGNGSSPTNPPGGTAGNGTLPSNERALNWINREWAVLPNGVKTQILQLIQSSVPADQTNY